MPFRTLHSANLSVSIRDGVHSVGIRRTSISTCSAHRMSRIESRRLQEFSENDVIKHLGTKRVNTEKEKKSAGDRPVLCHHYTVYVCTYSSNSKIRKIIIGTSTFVTLYVRAACSYVSVIRISTLLHRQL